MGDVERIIDSVVRAEVKAGKVLSPDLAAEVEAAAAGGNLAALRFRASRAIASLGVTEPERVVELVLPGECPRCGEPVGDRLWRVGGEERGTCTAGHRVAPRREER